MASAFLQSGAKGCAIPFARESQLHFTRGLASHQNCRAIHAYAYAQPAIVSLQVGERRSRTSSQLENDDHWREGVVPTIQEVARAGSNQWNGQPPCIAESQSFLERRKNQLNCDHYRLDFTLDFSNWFKTENDISIGT